MTIKERLKALKKSERLNQARTNAFVARTQKRRLHGVSEKPNEYRGGDKKKK